MQAQLTLKIKMSLNEVSSIAGADHQIIGLHNTTRRRVKMITFKQATKEQAGLLLDFIKGLAITEGFPHELTVTESDLIENLLSPRSIANAHLVYDNDEPCGFFVYYFTFSTTTGRKGLHLDDLYILEDFQGKGIGTDIMKHLENLAKSNGCARFEWWCLENNKKAEGFYRELGARKLDELRVYRMETKRNQ
ncbi:GNAT family N-acetyltransferase [Vibrio vulnificus]|nr:GNAT family N-acetyltransferase [Vibrio kanaloae]